MNSDCNKLIGKDIFENIKVSYFKVYTGKECFEIPVSRILRGIKSDYFKPTVENVRKYRDSNIPLSKQYKTQLHAVTFSGLFPCNRKQEECTQYNNLLVIDIDHIEAEKLGQLQKSVDALGGGLTKYIAQAVYEERKIRHSSHL